MWKHLILGAAVLAVPAATEAQRQRRCGTHDEIVFALAERYQEVPVARAIVQNGNLLEVFVSSGGSWTIVVTTPQGQACAVSSGESWDPAVFTPPGRTS